jgi:hypothetical protein
LFVVEVHERAVSLSSSHAGASRTSDEKHPTRTPASLAIVASSAPTEPTGGRLAAIREQLTLLADYL